MDGLENKLDGVHLGDLISLQSPQLEATGYVVDYNPKQVKLSHENPFSEMAGIESWDKDYRKGLFSGDRWYNLRKFESYEVLRQHKPAEEKTE
jgi:hypothetical protein